MRTTPLLEATLGRALCRGVVLVLLVAVGIGLTSSAAWARTFDPKCVITDTAMRATDAMSAAQVQAFLDAKPGPLKRMSFPRHDNGSVAPASVLIWEACQAWKISPRVMLSLLQKEQSLVTRTSLAPHTLERAVGAGCPDAYTNKFPGFGNQVWHGARLLDGYGEEGKTTEYVPHPWTPDLLTPFTGEVGRTTNLATYKLYVYNPSIGANKPYGDLSGQSCSGNANFWKIYSTYFGNPLVKPIRSSLATSKVKWIRLDGQYEVAPYDVAVDITGRLVAEPTTATIGAIVRLESLGRRGWLVVRRSGRYVDAEGGFTFRVSGKRVQRLRVALEVPTGTAAVASGMVVADTSAVLSKPIQVGTASSTAVARATGTIVPAHAGVVTVTAYQTSKGIVRRTRAFAVRTSASGLWGLRVPLTAGAWTVYARHQDAGHALSYSALSTISVR